MTTETPATAGRIEIQAALLRDLLTAGLACTSQDPDEDHPAFLTLNLEARNGRLTVVATDRYTLVHASRACQGELNTTLPAAGTRRMLADLDVLCRADDGYRAPGADEVVTLTADADGQVTLASTIGLVGCPKAGGAAGLPAAVTKLIETGGWEKTLAGPLAIMPGMLARLQQITATVGPVPARLYIRGAQVPVRVEIEDWMIVLLMPVKLPTDTPAGPQIPVGLPDTPITVDLVDPERSEITWPRTRAGATPERMIRNAAAMVVHLQNRVFAEPFPDVPKYVDQNPKQRRLASARADLYRGVADSFAIALLMRELDKVAPAAARAAARELWDQVDGGDSMGEFAWWWLKLGHIDPDKMDGEQLNADQQARTDLIGRHVFAAGRPDTDPLAAGEVEPNEDAVEVLARIAARTKTMDGVALDPDAVVTVQELRWLLEGRDPAVADE